MTANTLDDGMPGLNDCDRCPLGHQLPCNWYRQLPVDIHHPFKDGEIISKGTWGCNQNWMVLINHEWARQVVNFNANLDVMVTRMTATQQEAALTQAKLIHVFEKMLGIAQSATANQDAPSLDQIPISTPELGEIKESEQCQS